MEAEGEPLSFDIKQLQVFFMDSKQPLEHACKFHCSRFSSKCHTVIQASLLEIQIHAGQAAAKCQKLHNALKCLAHPENNKSSWVGLGACRRCATVRLSSLQFDCCI